ncbi:hypothetical protein [Brevundimonas sp. SGAir0440]|uniref:hypothetical protein n=1 Tax=Brevundimonas sp. SGAir0440 TaxID=2579977 RepID=UPI0010CD687C|nr:hypothetical protein [Brevundimonas sp. SGAir0440]QCQ99117.1 hypothetical protein E7T10_10765 [Brevundimonas sp. SGAir0440]
MKKWVMAFALAMISSAASAGDWRFVSIGDDFAAGIDFSRRTRTGDIARAWVINSGTTKFQLFLAEFDCRQSSMTVLTSATYDNLGNVIGQSSARGAPVYSVPDTVGDNTLRAACDNKPNWLAGLNETYDRARDFHDATGRVLFK